MNRRSFIAALAALPVAGKAIETLANITPAWARGGPVWTRAMGVGTTGRFSHITLQKAYRRMQGDMLGAFQSTTEEWEWL